MLTSLTTWLASARKALVAALGVAVTLLTVYNRVPFLPDQPLVASILGAVTVVLTYLVPNKS